MQTRGHVLLTNIKRNTLFPGSEPSGPCCETCGEIESEHHVFVTCPCYANERDHCIIQLQNQLKKRLKEATETADDEDTTDNENINLLKHLVFQDSDIWRTGVSRHYLGVVPRIRALPQGIDKPTIVKLIHTEMILAAGLVWSTRMKNRYNRIGDDFCSHAESLMLLHVQPHGSTDNTEIRTQGMV